MISVSQYIHKNSQKSYNNKLHVGMLTSVQFGEMLTAVIDLKFI